jgi:hypothetical protein
MQARNVFRGLKRLFLSSRRQPIKIRFGAFCGVRLHAVPADSLQIIFGLSERETYKYIRQAMRRATWFVDIGAGFGEMSIMFDKSSRLGPIVAVKPWSMDILRENIALNGQSRIVLIDRYLGTEPGQLALDDLPVPRDRPGFIKLDADTAELAILRSGRRLLAEARPLLLVETHSAELERDCSALLAGLGYRLGIIANARWRALIPEQRPIPHSRWLWAEPA